MSECESLFLLFWEQNPDVFQNPYTIKDSEFWYSFWNNCPFTIAEIEEAMSNLVEAVKWGACEHRYISPHPDVFLSGQMLRRGLEDFNYIRKFGKKRL